MKVKALTSSFAAFTVLLCAAPVALAKPKRAGMEKVYGKIQVVDAFPDYKVRIVTHFPDLKIQVVKAFADAPGKWQFVKAFPDFKVQFVAAGEDFTIQFVNAFPGPGK